MNDGWDFPLPHADFGSLWVSDHSAIVHGDCEENRRTNRGRVEKGERANECSPPSPDDAVVAHPKIAEVREREGEIPTSASSAPSPPSLLVLLQERSVQPLALQTGKSVLTPPPGAQVTSVQFNSVFLAFTYPCPPLRYFLSTLRT